MQYASNSPIHMLLCLDTICNCRCILTACEYSANSSDWRTAYWGRGNHTWYPLTVIVHITKQFVLWYMPSICNGKNTFIYTNGIRRTHSFILNNKVSIQYYIWYFNLVTIKVETHKQTVLQPSIHKRQTVKGWVLTSRSQPTLLHCCSNNLFPLKSDLNFLNTSKSLWLYPDCKVDDWDVGSHIHTKQPVQIWRCKQVHCRAKFAHPCSPF